MKKRIIYLFLIFLMVSCTERMTKQFIVETPDSTPQMQVVENWVIEPPELIAYKNISVSEIKDISYQYWLSIKSYSQREMNSDNILEIDSVGLHFIELDSTIWRTPSRVVPYKQSNKYSYLAFDFFKNKGIQIPDTVLNIRLFFDAVIVDTIKDLRSSHEITFDMVRQDTTQKTPFMIQ